VISASEGIKFSDTIKEFTAQIKELGPGPFRHIEIGGKEQK
jgi:coenzyme F420-reducing hydrogenase delta subunit